MVTTIPQGMPSEALLVGQEHWCLFANLYVLDPPSQYPLHQPELSPDSESVASPGPTERTLIAIVVYAAVALPAP